MEKDVLCSQMVKFRATGHANYLDLDPLVAFMLRQGCCDLYTLFARIKTKVGVHWGPAALNTKALLCLQHRLLHFLRVHNKYSEPTLSLQSVNTLYQTFRGFSSYSKASLFSKIQAIHRLCFWICNMQPSAGNWPGRYLVTRREYLMYGIHFKMKSKLETFGFLWMSLKKV